MTRNFLALQQIIRLPELAETQGLRTCEVRVEQIIKGGMGQCLRVRHIENDDLYALKTIDPSWALYEEAWERWRREMRVWLQLSVHSGIVPAYCICRVNEIPCVVAKWMSGGNLRRVLANRDPNLFYHIVLRTVQTLEWAHKEQGIIHRDLKPENLLIDRENTVHIGDWGLAKYVSDFTAVQIR